MKNAVSSWGGIIFREEEYRGACRVISEQFPDYYTITCMVHGVTINTAFCDADQYDAFYVRVKEAVAKFYDERGYKKG